jgi:hypothetical protein
MTLQDALEFGGAILLSLGGGTGVLFAFSSWLGKVWAERILTKEKAQQAQDLETFKKKLQEEAERHKIRLKKSELIFAREFEAASALVAMNRDISPKFLMPDMDYYDACDQVASDFEKIEGQLHSYVRTHGAVLPDGVKRLISLCMGIAGEHKFSVQGPDVPTSVNSEAALLLGHLKQAENEMLAQVSGQIEK